MQNKLKIAIIGCGNMGSSHLKNIISGEIKNGEAVAVCDTDIEVRNRVKKEFSLPVFENHIDMFNKIKCDAVIIATPHYSHPKIAIDAFKYGKSVLTEKPVGILPSEIKLMISTAKKSNKKFAIMFNQRTHPLFIKAKELVENGEIGIKKRLVWIITNWYRTQSYYDSGSWRATWKGEGGGVLTNQAPHQLDLMQWIFGMPKSVFSKCYIGKYHNIEVEDDATAIFEYENGETATFITSTGESPGTNRLEIVGDKGKIVLEEGKLKFWKLKKSERDFCFTEKQSFYQPEYEYFEFYEKDIPNGHITILNNFCNACLYDEPLIASGYDGIKESIITQSIYLSYFKNKQVQLSKSSHSYEKELKKRIKKSFIRSNVKSQQDENHLERWKVRW